MESAYTITTGAFPVQPNDEDAPSDYVKSEKRKTFMRVVARGGVTAACVVVAIMLPEFGRLMAFLGSFTTFCICVLLPVS
jgi:vesicular inhibitory amino acid transporter